MKLKELAIEGLGVHRNLQLGRFGDGLTIVYGENGAGKTAVREFIQGTLFGLTTGGYLADRQHLVAGRLNVSRGVDEFQLRRDVGSNTLLDVRPLNLTSGFERSPSLPQLAGAVNQELYETVFSFSFRETATNAMRLARVLHSQLGVPYGPAAAGDHSGFLNWQRETTSRQARLEVIRARIDALNLERAGYQKQIEAERNQRNSKIAEFENSIREVVSRLNELQASTLPDDLSQLEREIARLRLLIDSARPRVVSTEPKMPPLDQFSSLYVRLDEFDNQIRRWRHVQSDIQNQRVRLRDEMLVWNELTLDSDEHPYHTSRAILVALESKVDEAERNATLWSEAGGSRVDTSQMARTLSHLCQSMRNDLYGLCNELAQQYKFIRHKAAAAELKQLRRCYTEMGENIDRLVKRREALIRDIRSVDPAGADAIVRADLKFCQCAQHEGYLEARRRLVGELPLTSQAPSYTVNPPDLQKERTQLASLEFQLQELTSTVARRDAESQELEIRHADLVRQRESLLNGASLVDVDLQVRAIDSELDSLNKEFNALRQRLELNREYVALPPDPVLERACRWLGQITSGDLTQVFLGEPFVTAERVSQIEIQVRDRFGKVLNLSALEPYRQDQVYLSLILAAKEQLTLQGVEVPTIIDDAFNRIPSDQATATLTCLNEFAAAGHQVVALTQHRYLSDRIPGLPVLELPPTLPSTQPVGEPERRSGFAPLVAPLRETDWGSDPDQLDGQFVGSQTRPYPLSKYPRSSFNHEAHERSDLVAYPFPQVGALVQESAQWQPSQPAAAVSPVAVNMVGDRLGYVAAVNQSMQLGKAGLFDSPQLRRLEANGIVTVGDLLAVDFNQAAFLGINSDQLERWQSQLWLLINVPGMRVSDARVLVACGIMEPEQLETSHPQQLLERITRFEATSEGRRFMGGRQPISLEHINGWYRSLDTTRSNWDRGQRERQSRGQSAVNNSASQSTRFGDDGSSNESRKFPRAARPNREPREARSPRMNTPTPERKVVPRMTPVTSSTRPGNETSKTESTASKQSSAASQDGLKFYLDLNDHIEAAPAIGPKTAERFEKINVCSVADFLKQTAESLALKIKYKRISANVIRQWQQQARFVCRVPNLRGHDAQLLVACGITEPEELATMQPKALFDIIGPFAETKEGMKIIRNGKKPDLAEITDWIAWAADTRSLQAA